MDKDKPFVLSFVGASDSGKTTLILKLLPELKAKGYRVAVAKHCPCGFDLDQPGKDSWQFAQAGSTAIFLSSPKAEAMIRPQKEGLSIEIKLKDYFSDFDIVLTEGYNNEPSVQKIQVVRKGIKTSLLNSEDIIAYISDMELNTDKLVLKLDDVSGIILFLENIAKKAKK